MIPVYYDLHIHSALSPCAGDDMTPNDIVGMAVLNGLDLIAITDHNSVLNAVSVVKAAKASQEHSGKELIVLPGVEVATVEEVHVLCLFADIESVLSFESDLTPFYSPVINRIDIFGRQLLMDENDCIKGEMERMLIAPATISFDDLYFLTQKHNGAFIPAHIDRNSFSVISNLGFLPPHLDVKTVEISISGLELEFEKNNAGLIEGRKTISSSDAHQLWSINEKEQFIMLPERTAKAAIDFLR